MNPEEFSREFGLLYHQLYVLAVRRINDSRDRISNETLALLQHLAQAGPLSLSEIVQHFGLAMSTLSSKVTALEACGWLSRQSDAKDARRSLIWLTPSGLSILQEAQSVLDSQCLSLAAQALSLDERVQILTTLRRFTTCIAKSNSEKGMVSHENPM